MPCSTWIPSRFSWTAIASVMLLWSPPVQAAAPGEVSRSGNADRYADIVLKDSPVAYWRFNGDDLTRFPSQGDEPLDAVLAASAAPSNLRREGPRPGEFPLFGDANQAVEFRSTGQYYRVSEAGDKNLLVFNQNDSITLEAWVNPERPASGGFSYVIGKGRTKPGQNNQNYALRLAANERGAAISFLFRSAGEKGDWHRWTSKETLSIGDGWHHIAVSYKFGDPKSIRGYIDGDPVKGDWDMGGASANPPVVDQDDVWIGSSMGGSASSTFRGGLDEVAVYRAALTPEQIKARYQYVAPKYTFDATRIPEEGVLVDLFEGLPDKKSWDFRPPRYVESYLAPGFGFVDVPKKYNSKAVQTDRSNPFLLRAYGYVTIPEGEQRILVRCRNASRVYLDDKLIAETKFHKLGGDNGPILEIDYSLAPHIHGLHRGDTEDLAIITGDGQRHLLAFETIVGGGERRPELGETGVFISRPGEDFRLLGSSTEVLLTDAGWEAFEMSQQEFLAEVNAQRRREAGVAEAKYWEQRHAYARSVVEQLPALNIPAATGDRVNGEIDRFLNAALTAAGKSPAPLCDDDAFLRRVTLDITGRIPTLQEIERYRQEDPAHRRSQAIDRLLDGPEWADGWIGYWQDVLAENPNILNPTLNNTGPFRWWIEESFRDNKPFDRFVTELVMMEGSEYYGGPAGFGMATQNDSPMAAKSHILGEAFLAVELKCARCHDAPYHDLDQRDLFSMAAMLKRSGEAVPETSTIPGGASNSVLVEVTLKPGEVVPPEWPFEKLSSAEPVSRLLRNAQDTRERLALLITSPHNDRFAKVIANRLWQRYLGQGLVEPVDDWEFAQPSHPELLEYLARELMTHDYDLKHLARLIFQSDAYQRKPAGSDVLQSEKPYLFAAPIQRRMSAEQLVDSLFVACGKPFDADVMNIDIDTSRSYKSSLNLGKPRRAWQFGSLSNERDRPSLALPFAQPFVSALETFGWRSSRQDPLTVREAAPSPLQPAELENGLLSRRVCTLSEDSAFTALALQDIPLEQLLDQLFERILARGPTPKEKELFRELLASDYETRRVQKPEFKPVPRLPRTLVAWTNHLDPQANVIKQKLEEEVRRGDAPTPRLVPDWRERLEDVIWTLVNSPEFVFVP